MARVMRMLHCDHICRGVATMSDPKEPSRSEIQAGGHVEVDDADGVENQRRDAAEVDNE